MINYTIPIIDTSARDTKAREHREVADFVKATADANPTATKNQVFEAVAVTIGKSRQYVKKCAEKYGVLSTANA